MTVEFITQVGIQTLVEKRAVPTTNRCSSRCFILALKKWVIYHDDPSISKFFLNL